VSGYRLYGQLTSVHLFHVAISFTIAAVNRVVRNRNDSYIKSRGNCTLCPTACKRHLRRYRTTIESNNRGRTRSAQQIKESDNANGVRPRSPTHVVPNAQRHGKEKTQLGLEHAVTYQFAHRPQFSFCPLHGMDHLAGVCETHTVATTVLHNNGASRFVRFMACPVTLKLEQDLNPTGKLRSGLLQSP
jgi:hypothetical protein